MMIRPNSTIPKTIKEKNGCNDGEFNGRSLLSLSSAKTIDFL